MVSGSGTSASKYALICNGKQIPCELSSEELLKSFPRGPYTTARTHELSHVFEFEFHNRRIAESTQLMVQAGTLPKPLAFDQLIRPDSLRSEYLNCVRKAVETYQQQVASDVEMKLTTLLNVNDASEHQLLVHVQALGTRPAQPVDIQIMGAPRENALAKDSGWVSARQGLWDGREKEVHEVVLCDKDGFLYEGLSSNFFVMARDASGSMCCYTAGSGVLLGTVRGLALDLCHPLGIKVVEEPPNIKDLQSWEEVFISSTSRWVLPVGKIVLQDKTEWTPKSTSQTESLYRLMLEHVMSKSMAL
eukprot:CAMPEP_0184300250 /NCGR_PEP_ID=MMETSP1049-20130417/10701_1 /TAXON_ID=77928 /ORGANISM="Proteomonas sulcata, Strain CCMP704" /LENGTH=303 /DNA_ID=CAMNT_0026610915 /DNA_START=118 /DNA_END=1029 /DNA_ORIENTATION=+